MNESSPPPRPRSLPVQVADEIALRIEDGQWHPELPGEVALARLFDVSRPTIRSALKILEQRNRVEPATAGSRRRINALASGKSRTLRTVRLVTPKSLGELTPAYQDSIGDIRGRLQRQGCEVIVEACPRLWSADHPQRLLQSAFRDSAIGCHLIFDPTPAIEQWLEEKSIPCVCFGGSYRHHLPRVGSEGDLTITLATRELIALGHTRIVYPIHDGYGFQMADPMRKELERHGIVLADSAFAPRWSGHATNAVVLYEKLFRRPDPPTAFITLGLRNLLPLMTWLGKNRIVTPDDVSIIHLLGDPLLEMIHPPVTHYRAERQRLRHAATELVLKVLLAGKPFDQARMIPMKRQEGRTVGPPPSQRRNDPAAKS